MRLAFGALQRKVQFYPALRQRLRSVADQGPGPYPRSDLPQLRAGGWTGTRPATYRLRG